ILNIQYYHPETNTAQGISLNRFDRRFQLVYRLDAESAVYLNGRWHLKKVVEQTLADSGRGYDVKVAPELIRSLPITPADLKTVARQPSEMSFFELRRYIHDVEADGYDATAARVDLYAKIAYPFTCLIMGLIGLAVAVRGRVRDGMVTGIIYGIGIIFVYWIFYSFCLSLGYGNLLPPLVAAWLANILFTCFGWVLFSYAQ
ncbi:MAG: LptF/LptG family permease, partial [Desulfosarcinaceae bacterium]